MICEKCGAEFSEGRNCPECGALAIFVKEDEYQERRQEWEEENASTEESAKKKLQLNIHVDPVILKKAIIMVAVVCVIATAIFGIMRVISNYVSQEQYLLVYDNGIIMNSDSGAFDVYPVENAIFSADGNYVYKDVFCKEGIQGEIISQYVSPSGEYAAYVSMEGTETAEYFLYIVKTIEQTPVLVRSGVNELNIIEVTSEGGIFFEEAEIGAYSVVLSAVIYHFDGEKVRLVTEECQYFVTCENEEEFIYYDSQMQAYLYSDGNVEAINDGECGYEYARTNTGKLYWLNEKGELYQEGVKGSIDRGIAVGSLRIVANSDKVIYSKDGSLYCVGGSMDTPIKLLEHYDSYGDECRVMEKHDKIYYIFDNALYSCESSGKVKKVKDDILNVYLSIK